MRGLEERKRRKPKERIVECIGGKSKGKRMGEKSERKEKRGKKE